MNALGADLIPDATTAGGISVAGSPEADVTTWMEAINAVRPKLWAGRCRELLGPVAHIDADGTIAPYLWAAQGRDGHLLQGHLGVRALIVSLANAKEVLYLVNRSGNAPSHARAAGWIDKAIELVAPHAERGVPARGHRLLVDRELRQVGRAGRFRVRPWIVVPGHSKPALPTTPDRGRGQFVLVTTSLARPPSLGMTITTRCRDADGCNAHRPVRSAMRR